MKTAAEPWHTKRLCSEEPSHKTHTKILTILKKPKQNVDKSAAKLSGALLEDTSQK